MEGVSDFAFRYWLSLCSQPDFQSTPFLRVTPTYPNNGIPSTYAPEWELKESLNYYLVPQIMASSRSLFIKHAREILNHSPFVDLNCGCPAAKSVGKGAGSSLLIDSAVFIDFVKTITEPFEKDQISVKIRTGFDNDDNYYDCLHGIKDTPIKQLGIHGRTKAQRYDGLANWSMIAEANDIMNCPIVASGDINSYESLEERQQFLPSVSKIIIGRGAIRNPWIFSEIKTGCKSEINIEALIYCLASLGIIQYAFKRESETLINLIAEKKIVACAGTDQDLWESTYKTLCEAIFGKFIYTKDLDFERYTFARIKMVWNYLRSSLPEICPKVTDKHMHHEYDYICTEIWTRMNDIS